MSQSGFSHAQAFMSGAFRLLSTVVGVCGGPGATAHGPVGEECSIPSAPVTTLCPKMGASIARAKGSSTDPVTLRPVLITTVRKILLIVDFGFYLVK